MQAFVHRHHNSGYVKLGITVSIQRGAGYDQIREANDELVLQIAHSIAIYCSP